MTDSAALKRLSLAAQRMQAGDDAQAETDTRALLSDYPEFARAHALLGRLMNRRQDLAAEASLRRALDLEPEFAPARLDLVVFLRRNGRTTEALPWLQQMADANPGNALLATDLGSLQLESGDASAAIATLKRVVEVQPSLHEAWPLLSRAHAAKGDLRAAMLSSDKALQGRPDSLPVVLLWASLRLQGGHHEAALGAADSILGQFPDHAEAREIKVSALRHLGDDSGARVLLEQLCVEQPNRLDLWAQLGAVALAKGETDDARHAFGRGLQVDPDHYALRWAHMQCLPRLYADNAAMQDAARRWSQEMDAFHELLRRKPFDQGEALDCLQGPTAFYRHYIPGDLRPSQERMAEALQTLSSAVTVAAPRSNQGGKVRVGFASALYRRHTVSRLFGDTLRDLDRTRFEVHALHLEDRGDAITTALAESVDHFHRARPVESWLRDIPQMGLDVLVYLDIGMHPIAQALSSFRLAPVQAMTWGHPVTSGQPCMDLFLSSTLMERADSDVQYSERLLRLPHHGLYCSPPDLHADQAFSGRFTHSALHLVCAQSPVKLLPDHLDLFARVAAAVPSACFSFIGGSSQRLQALLEERIRDAFAAHGQDFESRVEVLPFLKEAEFLALLASADLVLDTPDWSGGQTALDTLWMNSPIVTLGGDTLRARHSLALLTRIGLAELVVASEHDYIAKVVELTGSQAAREALRNAIERRKRLLYHDRSVLAALEDTLERAALSARSATP